MSFVVYLRVGTVFQTAAYFMFVIPRLRPGLLSLRSVLSSRQTLTEQKISIDINIKNIELYGWNGLKALKLLAQGNTLGYNDMNTLALQGQKRN